MYRGSSPIFDVPEFPTLRRVKPLPKRRRTSSNTTLPDADVVVGSVPVGNGILLPPSLEGLTMPGPDATPEELLVHADQLSARMAISSYYMPMLSAAPDFSQLNSAAMRKGFGAGGKGGQSEMLLGATGEGVDQDEDEGVAVHGEGVTELVPHDEDPEDEHSQSYTESNVTLSDLDLTAASLDYGMGYPVPGVRTSGGGIRGPGAEIGIVNPQGVDDEHGDGDFMEHLQQPGNTKKRKVPTNVPNSPREHHDLTTVHTIAPDDINERGELSTFSNGRSTNDYDAIGLSSSQYATTLSLLAQKKSKLAAATLAGLQHKEMLKTRKRQLAAVLGALSHGDALALDQALSANYPFNSSAFDDLTDPPKVRLSRRRALRMARALRQLAKKHKPPNRNRVRIPRSEFTFVFPSATADRLIATKEEVAMLRNRFEAELARQAAKAAKLAAANKLMTESPPRSTKPAKPGKSKRHQNTHALTTNQQHPQQQSQQESSLRNHSQQLQQQRGRTSKRGGGVSKMENQGAPVVNGTTVGKGVVGSERQQNMTTSARRTEPTQHSTPTNRGPGHVQESTTPVPTTTFQQQLLEPPPPPHSSFSSSPSSEAANHTLSPSNAKSSRGKKKKRSALANASNPHHLRNYVPSRLPNSGSSGYYQYQQQIQQQGGPGGHNSWISPLPLKFLMAEISPRKSFINGQGPPPSTSSTVSSMNGSGGRRKKSSGTELHSSPYPTYNSSASPYSSASGASTYQPLTNPADEWICAFCEYDLFYGDEVGYRRAIRNRKKILKRRRRARERAAAAASGVGLHAHSNGDGSANGAVNGTATPSDGTTHANGGPGSGYGTPVKKGSKGGAGAKGRRVEPEPELGAEFEDEVEFEGEAGSEGEGVEYDEEEYEYELGGQDQGYDPVHSDGFETMPKHNKMGWRPGESLEREREQVAYG
ncbi:hypothetical protein AX16_003277 [Volvariella volvacea WC 439]|nr:hypothetical protein AX16_003277 [Volvariella volvacea WC 439]